MKTLENAEEKFAIGIEYTGKIVEIKQFGMFVEIFQGVDMPLYIFLTMLGLKKMKLNTSVGDEVSFKIIGILIQKEKKK